jgi:predicted ATPase
LCKSSGDDAALMKVQLGLEGYHFMRGDFAQAREYASQAAAMAARGSDPVPQLQARWAVANILMHQGDFVSAVEHMDACLKTYEDLTHRPSAVQDPGVMCLCYSAWGLWEMGYPDQGLQRAVRAVDLAKALRHSFSMGVAYGFRSTLHYFRGEFDDARTWAERAIEVCEDAGFVVWLAHAKVMHGRVLAELGEPTRGVDEMRIGYDMWAETGAVVTRPFYLAMQAEGLALARRFDEALVVVDQALQVVEEHGERYYEAEIRRLRGEFTYRSASLSDSSRATEAERWLLGAIKVAEVQQLGSLVLRGALSLVELWLQAGRQEEAIGVLETAIGKVHGGDTTLDLSRARRVLQELQLSESVGSG